MKSITVVTSLPHPCLNPNGRPHPLKLHREKKRAKTTAHYAALEACNNSPPRWERASIRATFYVKHPVALRADQDNRVASLKAHCDGIAAAGIVVNDRGLNWESPPIAHVLDKVRPRVEITITEAA